MDWTFAPGWHPRIEIAREARAASARINEPSALASALQNGPAHGTFAASEEIIVMSKVGNKGLAVIVDQPDNQRPDGITTPAVRRTDSRAIPPPPPEMYAGSTGILQQVGFSWVPNATETGHGKAPDPAMQKYEQDVAARNAIIAENSSIRESNRTVNQQIAEAEKVKGHLEALTSIWDWSGSFTRAELNDHCNSATLSPEIKAAARWMLSKSDAELAAYGIAKGNEGVTEASINVAIGNLATHLDVLRAQIRQEKEVPSEPVRPGPASGGNASTGSAGGAGNVGGTGNAGGAGNASGSDKAPSTDKKNSLTPTHDAVPPFASSAVGVDRIADAVDHLTTRLDALYEDIGNTTDPGQLAKLNRMAANLERAQTMLMDILKRQQELQSNMAKMFSDMAKSAIQNMR